MDAPNMEAPGQAQGQSEERTEILAESTARRKADATRIAKAAMRGHELRRLADGTWLVSNWNLSRELADDAACDAWLQRVGAA